MFAQYHDVSRKRLRDDELENLVCGFGEHRNKRLALPVRTLPNSQNRPSPSPFSSAGTHDVNATGSDQDQTMGHQAAWPPSPPCENADMDMAMDLASPPQEPQSFQSFTVDHISPMVTDHNQTGRMPTPIQPSFGAQHRGTTGWGSAGYAPSPVQMNGVVNMGHVHSGAVQDRAVPRTMQGAEAWPADVSRRIPSPIMEGDGLSGNVSPSMSVDSGVIVACHDHACDEAVACSVDDSMADSSVFSPSFPNKHPRQPGNYEPYDPDDSLPPLVQTTSAPATPVPGRSPGHIRSRHTLNNWTLQPGMKKSFSMGFRADCDKCRAKVPGHFNHIIIS
ncbi:hypothetical protein F5X68DRAFT_200602 [Plectosphaerella plurivora]|uniref:Uncharacterized protein n=1 Tax=Plectosphaerella plurivora TaxID=936078 RepID=A0A9P8VJC5_9PEZI|nr:hypothetical protein F5X68DRAFT_200602 [Plectosphaerella plurivora]